MTMERLTGIDFGQETPEWCRERTTTGATNYQVAGTHYKDMKIQPIDYIQANGLGYCEGNVVKYVSRWRNKGGLEDLRKAKQYIEFLMEEAGE